MSCVWDECKDWTWDGDPCYKNRKGTIGSMYWDDGMSSFRIKEGCEDKQMRAYEHPLDHSPNDYFVMRGAHANVPDGWNDRVSAVKEVDVPRTKDGHLVDENDEGCPGAGEQWEKSAGTRFRCFYSNSDVSQIRNLYDHATTTNNGKLLAMHTRLTEKFCAIPENLEKRVSAENTCKKLDSSVEVTKQYCKLNNGQNLRTKDACSQSNLGRFYEEVGSEYCKNNPNEEWCACYNVKANVCDTNASAAGCAKMKEEHDAIINSLPADKLGEQARRELNNRKTCRALVCSGDKFIPQNLPGCELDISMCIQDVSIAGHAVDTGINIECNIDEKTKNEVTEGEKREEKGFSSTTKGVEKNVPVATVEAVGMATADGSKNAFVFGGGLLSFVLACCCCLMIVVIAMSMGGGNNN